MYELRYMYLTTTSCVGRVKLVLPVPKMKLTIYIWFSLVLVPCLAYETYFEEDSGNSLISLKQNGITKSESAKKIGTMVAVATIGAVIVLIGTIQPLLLLVPLVIAWFGVTLFLTFITLGFSYDSPHRPQILPIPIEFILLFVPMLFVSPLYALYILSTIIENHFDTPRHVTMINYDSIQ